MARISRSWDGKWPTTVEQYRQRNAPQSQTITSVDGIPTTLLLDPRGRMKCTYTVARDGTATFGPTDIRNITVPVTELDYYRVDTISRVPAPKVCTSDGKCN